MIVLPINLPFGRALSNGLGADEEAPSLAFLSSSFLRAVTTLTLCLVASVSTKRQQMYVGKAYGKNKSDGDGRKSTYEDESIHPI